ncbi:MAG: hypothetical protein ACP5PT_07600 [Brevinematia bacterium]|jgi:predicted Holliday junction resolvase-like endonuclease
MVRILVILFIVLVLVLAILLLLSYIDYRNKKHEYEIRRLRDKEKKD